MSQMKDRLVEQVEKIVSALELIEDVAAGNDDYEELQAELRVIGDTLNRRYSALALGGTTPHDYLGIGAHHAAAHHR